MDIDMKWQTELGTFRLQGKDEDWVLETPDARVRLDETSLARLGSAARRAIATRRAPRAGTPWTLDEDDKLRERFDTGLEPAELAAVHERSRGAILARLAALGLIDDTDVGRFRTRPPQG